ncbi:MAG TPA: hypothetical protein VI894_00700 [Candidatus Nanoarchaeia archaeon]|nr:hypothetical protein [Candidatus Nanoarchaeia archaeon]
MSKKDNKKKHATIDDFFEDVRGKHAKKLEDAFKHYEETSSEENQLHLFNNIFTPAQQEFYNTFVAELSKEFKKDTEELHEKKKEVERAAAAGLKKYFEKTMPGVAKAAEDIKDIEDQYEFLARTYDEHVGVGKIEGVNSLKSIIKTLMKNKKTIGHLKQQLKLNETPHITGAMAIVTSKAHQHYFSTYNPYEITAYVGAKIKKDHPELEIEDKLKYLQSEPGKILHLHNALSTGDFSDIKFGELGLKYRKKESKKKH